MRRHDADCVWLDPVDRRTAYFLRSAIQRANDPLAWQERYMRGVRIIAGLYLPKKKNNVVKIRRKSA